MDKKNLGYYESNIKTSRDNDSVYAMKYASQQILIDKLQQENQELKKQKEEWIDLLNMFKNQQKEFTEYLENLLANELGIFTEIKVCDVLSKYKSIIGVSDEQR